MHSIDELIWRSLRGRTSPDEERKLREWRNAAAENESYFQQWARVLAAVGAAVERHDTLYAPTGAEIVGIAEAATAPRHSARPSTRLRWAQIGMAAAVVGALALGGVYYALDRRPAEFRMGSGEYASGPNETATATLADGTVIRLAPNSRLRILDNPGRRDVELTGRAYLVVAPMPHLPFRVHTSLGEVAVLGTRFDVLATEELRVVVVEGKVALSAGRERVEIPAGQMSLVTNGALTRPVNIDVAPVVAWVGRFLAFQETPLRDVAKELEREYGTRVIIADGRLADLTVTGWYIDRTFEEVVVIICGVLGAECSIRESTATIGT